MGLNVFSHWATDPLVRPVMGGEITRESLGVCDPMRLCRLYPAIEYSNRFVAGMRKSPDGTYRMDATMIDGLGNGFRSSKCRGTLNIGRCVFENTDISGARAALEGYDALLVATRWNAQLLENATGRAVKVIYEGVDPSLFCPGPKSGLLPADKFHIFTGGKIEFRKAQDLVLLAFRRFHEKRSDSVLVTAWHSPWPRLSVGFQGRLPAPLEQRPDGLLDIGLWVARNGLDPASVIDLGFVPNALMPMVLREMDVSLQPSRAEAGTNFPVKEAMACGVPVIAAVNTGMKDLLTDENCIALKKQTQIDDQDGSMHGWGESDVDEIVAALEFAYERRDEARQIGIRSREWLIEHGRTWQSHANELKGWILSIR